MTNYPSRQGYFIVSSVYVIERHKLSQMFMNIRKKSYQTNDVGERIGFQLKAIKYELVFC